MTLIIYSIVPCIS